MTIPVRSQGGAWTPAILPGAAQILDPMSGVILTSGKVSTWTDLAGLHNATQGTALQRPTVTAADLNGNDVVTFTGIQNLIHTLQLQPPCTIAFVAKSTVDGSAGYAALASFCAGVAGPLVFAEASGITQWGVYANANALSGQSIRNSYKRCVAVMRAYNDIDFRTQGVSVHVTTGVSAYNAASLIGAGIGGGGQSLEGSIGYLSSYTGALSVADCQQIEAYFAARFAL